MRYRLYRECIYTSLIPVAGALSGEKGQKRWLRK